MAGSTIGPELPVVMIVGGMTGVAIHWRAFEHASCVTGLAIDIIVLAC